MDRDPELDVTLSDGREAATFQITAVEGGSATWMIVEPLMPLRVVVGQAAALDARHRLDAMIAARLEAGWVPVDAPPLGVPLVPPTPLPADLRLQLSSLLEALDRGRAALRAADPTGVLWAACGRLLRQARRFGVAAPRARVARAQRERRLGELAEEAGDVPAAILHYRAALAAHAGVGVRRQLSRLVAHWPRAVTASDRAPNPQPAAVRAGPPAMTDETAPRIGRVDTGRGAASRVRPHASDHDRPRSGGRLPTEEITTMAKHTHATTSARAKKTVTVQLVCRIDPALNEQVRAAADRAGQTLTTFIARALRQATAGRSPSRPPARARQGRDATR
jgi:hypothetical protein